MPLQRVSEGFGAVAPRTAPIGVGKDTAQKGTHPRCDCLDRLKDGRVGGSALDIDDIAGDTLGEYEHAGAPSY
jgi:hypothetical protein